MNFMDILVTGATGFVGRAIIEELVSNQNKNWKIYSLGNTQNINTQELPNFSRGDITDSEAFSSAEHLSKKLDVIIHAAGLAHQFQNPESGEFLKVNVEGTRNVLDFAVRKSVKHFILISSVSVYGFKNKNAAKENLKKIDENEPCFPKGDYAISKLKAEELAVKICLENNIALTILRLATVIGEGDQGNVSRLIKWINQKRFLKRFRMIGKGENYKTLIYKKDAARACRVILEKRDLSEKEVEIFNVAAEPIQTKFIVKKILEALIKKQPKFFLPFGLIHTPLKFFSVLFPSGKIKFLIKSLYETLSKWTSNEIFSNEKIEQKYSFKPETSISEAIEREVNFYIKNQ